MKSLLFILGLSLALSAVDVERHQKMVDFINKLRTTWTAKVHDRDIAGLGGSWKESEEIRLPEKTLFTKCCSSR